MTSIVISGVGGLVWRDGRPRSVKGWLRVKGAKDSSGGVSAPAPGARPWRPGRGPRTGRRRSEEHTSELQSRLHLVCRLLLEKKKRYTDMNTCTYEGLDPDVTSLATLNSNPSASPSVREC